MAVESEATDMTVKMVLEGSEMVFKLAGKGTAELAKALVKFAKVLHNEDLRTKGKVTFRSMLKSGEPLTRFVIPDNMLKAFHEDSKLYGLKYHIIRDKNSIDKSADIVVYQQDAAKVNRILEKLGLDAKAVDDIMKSSINIASAENDIPDRLIKFSENKIKLVSIPDIPEMPDKNSKNKEDIARIKRVQKYAKKIEKYGPDSVEKPSIFFMDGKATISDGEEILMALREAKYTEVVCSIMVADRPAPDRNETEKNTEINMEEKRESDPKTKEETQANPTTAPSQKADRASGAESKMSRNGEADQTSFSNRTIENAPLFDMGRMGGEQPFVPQSYFSTAHMDEEQAKYVESANLDVKSAMNKTEKNPNPESVYSALKGRCTKKAEHMNEARKAAQAAAKAAKAPEAIK